MNYSKLLIKFTNNRSLDDLEIVASDFIKFLIKNKYLNAKVQNTNKKLQKSK